MVPTLWEKFKLLRVNRSKLNVGLLGQERQRVLALNNSVVLGETIIKTCFGIGVLLAPVDLIRDSGLCKRLSQEHGLKMDQNYLVQKSIRRLIPAHAPMQGFGAHATYCFGFYGFFFGTLEGTLLMIKKSTLDPVYSSDMALAGALAGAVATAITHPLDTCRVHALSVQPGQRRTIASAVSAVSSQGFGRAFVGVVPASFRSALLWGPTFFLYDQLRCQLQGVPEGYACH
eukprot:TRINITY_DN65658_c0_g1_i1.p1 TRINITY_DN65658_c0_g1~~TRINITY_DN65658_c0_g1_i1.p1  ORF type:complete len:259 (+),score=19.64 TRINITY_DN65658_c0_g1_i1:90-779(+)